MTLAALDCAAQTAVADPPASAAPATKDGEHDEGIALTRDSGPFSVTLNGLAQARYTWTNPEGASSTQNFDIALARLALGGAAFEHVTYFFQLEASTFGNSNRLALLDGWVQYQTGASTSVKAGRILLPFSRQFLTHPGHLLFADLSRADYAFNLPRSVGAAVAASLRRVRVDAAVANSVRALDASGHRNGEGGLAAMARAELTLIGDNGYVESWPAGSPARELSVGVAGAYNPVVESSAFQNVEPGDRTTSATLDGNYRDRRFTLQAAFYYRRNDAGTGRYSDRGGYLQGGFYVVPAEWELVARGSSVDFGAAAVGRTATDVREYELGINRYLHGHNVKVQADAGLVRREHGTPHRDDRRARIQFQLWF